MTEFLRLKAKDAEDLQVVSAMVQDALVSTGDMSFDRGAQRFIFAASRFRWEAAESAGDCVPPVYEWINCAVRIDGVREIKCTQFDLQATSQIRELLALVLDGAQLKLVFAGGTELRLDLGDWTLRLEDFGAPWPTMLPPHHVGNGGVP